MSNLAINVDPNKLPGPLAPDHSDIDTSEEATADRTEQDEPVVEEFKPGTRFWLAWTSLCIVVLMAALDATSLSVALSQIAEALRGTAIEAFWAGTSFLLTSTVFQPVIGSLSGIFGRKNLLLVSLVFFVVGAIVAALSPNGHGMPMMLAGRSIQGIGGGGIIVLAEIIPTDLVPLRHRGNYMSFVGAMWAIGSVGGPLVGGALSGGDTWRWIFWINLPFVAIGGVMLIFFLNLNVLPDSISEKLKQVDIVGMVVFISSTTGLLIPLTWGGVQYPWDSWRTLVPLLVSAAGLVFFVIWEERFAIDPLIPLRVTKNLTAAVSFIGAFLHGMVLWCMLYYGPLYFEAVKGFTPLLSGVALFPSTFTVAPAAIFVGIVATKTGYYRWSIWIGWVFATLGFGLQYMIVADFPTYGWVLIMMVNGFGTGLLFPGLGFGVQAATAEEDVAPAIGLFTFLRTFGQAVGVALGGVVFQNAIKHQIASRAVIAEYAAEWAADSSALVQVIHRMAESPAKTALIDSYADALRIVWAVCCAFAGVGLILSIFIKGYSLDRALASKQQFIEGPKRRDSLFGMDDMVEKRAEEH